jgi:hypothetical protein
VLVSSQQSLQFAVADALKQLLFPMSWQFYCVQPANEALLGHAAGILPVIFCLNDTIAGFDYLQEMYNRDTAVWDIDACFTNSIDQPKIPEEQVYIRPLNGRLTLS